MERDFCDFYELELYNTCLRSLKGWNKNSFHNTNP